MNSIVYPTVYPKSGNKIDSEVSELSLPSDSLVLIQCRLGAVHGDLQGARVGDKEGGAHLSLLHDETLTVWFLVRNGGMDPYSSPYIIPNNSLQNPFPHSLLRTTQLIFRSVVWTCHGTRIRLGVRRITFRCAACLRLAA